MLNNPETSRFFVYIGMVYFVTYMNQAHQKVSIFAKNVLDVTLL